MPLFNMRIEKKIRECFINMPKSPVGFIICCFICAAAILENIFFFIHPDGILYILGASFYKTASINVYCYAQI